MQLRTLVETPSISISYDETNDWIYTDWKGVHDQETSRQCCQLILDCLRRQPCQKILNDNSNVSQTSFKITEWARHWLETLMHIGLKCIAWVFPREFGARHHTEQAVKQISQPTVVTFDDVATAYLWLQKV